MMTRGSRPVRDEGQQCFALRLCYVSKIMHVIGVIYVSVSYETEHSYFNQKYQKYDETVRGWEQVKTTAGWELR